MSSLFMAAVIWVIHPMDILMVLLSVLSGAIIYFVILLVIRGISQDEIKVFLGFIRDTIRLNR